MTAGGKNVSPEPLEESLSTHPLVGHVVAVGDGRAFVGALFTLDQEMLPVSIRDFRIIDAEFTVENGYLTPSLKLRRNKVVADHAAEIDKLYAEAKKELR